MKKTLSLFLSIIMLIITTVVPTSVGAEEDLITDEVISGEVDNTLPDTEESPEPTEESTATPYAESTVPAEETMHNIVYNGITIESGPKFADISIPVVALAGKKEQDEIIDSIKKMAEINRNCRFEIWDKAAHNIPPLFAKRFNELIRSVG